MAWGKNAAGEKEYCYKKLKTATTRIQEDWLKENNYKQGTFPPRFFEDIENELNPGERAYWANMIDGDGHVASKPVLKVQLTDREPIQRLADLYGSSIARVEYPDDKQLASSYGVQLHSKRAIHFMRLICPYMNEKRKKTTQIINRYDPSYHPPKISMDFRKNPDLILPHLGMVGGFFDSEGSVGGKIRLKKYKTQTLGNRVCYYFATWVEITNTNLHTLGKIKKMLQTWPFTFRPIIYKKPLETKTSKIAYRLCLPTSQHLLFMAMFAPFMQIQRKKNQLERFKLKKRIYKMCK